MNFVESILKEKKTAFLKQIKQMSDMSHDRHLTNKIGGFPVFFENLAYNEQSFFDERIENLIWRIFVNGVFKDLFSNEYCASEGIICEWQAMHPQITYSYVENTENRYPLEFILTKEGKRTGYRYTNCYWLEEQMEKVFENKSLDALRIIDFSSAKVPSFMHPLMVGKKFSERVCTVTLEDFFTEYFSRDEYEIYVKTVQEAVTEAYKYVGLQTIPNLTLQYLAYFIKQELTEIKESSLSQEEYNIICIDNLKSWLIERVNKTGDRISENDYQTMNEFFYDRGRYYAMCGSESFAHSFLTSEYLYQTMQTNNHFDYTAVVAGYLKAIEQLLYKTVLCTLKTGTDRELWIKYRYIKADKQPKTQQIRKTKHVRFLPENEVFFDTSFGPLVYLLNDNTSGWRVSKQAKNRIVTCLHIFCAECRNEHFHKDNISIEDIAEVKSIRHNAIMLFYYLLGAYAYTGNDKEDRTVLGIKDRQYDEMYQAIIKQSGGGDYFLLQFEGQKQILTAFPMSHGNPEYDEDGLLKNPALRFVKIDRDINDDWHQDNWHLIETDDRSNANIFITPDNMPISIQYIEKVSGQRVDIKW